MLKSFSKLLVYPFGQLILRPPRTLVKVDPSRPPQKQPVPLHNRWHPDIPAVATVTQGEVFRLECLDCTGGQIKYDDGTRDLETCDVGQVHYLSGPIHV